MMSSVRSRCTYSYRNSKCLLLLSLYSYSSLLTLSHLLCFSSISSMPALCMARIPTRRSLFIYFARILLSADNCYSRV